MRRIAKYYVVVYLVRKDAYAVSLAYIQQPLQLISLPYSTHGLWEEERINIFTPF